MTDLVHIGYWHSDQQPHLPHPGRFVDPTWDPDERGIVIQYLGGGLPIAHLMGYSPCRMCSEMKNGSAELTDGTYVWPEGLTHYVADHAVRLPREFVEHAVKRFEDLEKAAFAAGDRRFDSWLRMTQQSPTCRSSHTS